MSRRSRRQAGMTLVELVIAMSITAVLLAALTGVVFGANLITGTWGQTTYLAETAQLLPNQLQADAHRYVPCAGVPAGAALHLCVAGGSEAITYSSGPGCPCDLLRTDRSTGATTVVVRALQEPASFAATCTSSSRVDSGSISAILHYHGDAAPQPAVTVFFQAAAGSCGP